MRDKLLDILKNVHEAKEVIEINDMLGLKSTDEYRELSEFLEELVNEYIVFRTKKGKYILLSNCPSLKIGKLSVNKKGFGFIILDREDDIYVDDTNFNGAIDDDVVLVEVFTSGVRKEAKVIRIVKRELDNIVGEVEFNDKGEPYLKLDDDKKKIYIDLVGEKAKGIATANAIS